MEGKVFAHSEPGRQDLPACPWFPSPGPAPSPERAAQGGHSGQTPLRVTLPPLCRLPPPPPLPQSPGSSPPPPPAPKPPKPDRRLEAATSPTRNPTPGDEKAVACLFEPGDPRDTPPNPKAGATPLSHWLGRLRGPTPPGKLEAELGGWASFGGGALKSPPRWWCPHPVRLKRAAEGQALRQVHVRKFILWRLGRTESRAGSTLFWLLRDPLPVAFRDLTTRLLTQD